MSRPPLQKVPRVAGRTAGLLPALAAVPLLLLSFSHGPSDTTGAAETDLRQRPAGVQRLAYTITYFGIPVARALLDESRPEGAGAWTVRGAARTTAFWETFFHIGNSYTTRVDPGTFLAEGYEREIDERGRRYRRMVWYGEAGAEEEDDLRSLGPGGLPPVPERYRAEGAPEEVEVSRAPGDRYNLFAALWYLRYADWEQAVSAALPMVVDGDGWELTLRREGEEERKVFGRRVATWKIVCTFARTGAEPPEEEERVTDYVTQELVREEAEVTFWIEQAPSRRPIAVRVHRPGLTVKGEIREPFDEEVPPR